jgi:hypothetical protein
MKINITKALFKLLWDVAIKVLSIMLGWKSKSIKALTACHACTDHHKAWQILQIFYHGTALVILKPYMEKCEKNRLEPSISGLKEYVNSMDKYPSYNFMFQIVFTYIYGLNLLEPRLEEEISKLYGWQYINYLRYFTG